MAWGLEEFGGGCVVSGNPGLNGQGAADAEFETRVTSAFIREVYQPLFQRAALAPEDVPPVMHKLRELLQRLQEAIEPFDPKTEPGVAPAQVVQRNGATPPVVSQASSEASRNQRSKVRELILLEIMERENRACTLQQLMNGLASKGFGDTNAAVVSQLHRLKALGVVNVPGSGIYEITDPGLGHLRKLKQSFGALVPRG